jgi:hypothetical protein
MTRTTPALFAAAALLALAPLGACRSAHSGYGGHAVVVDPAPGYAEGGYYEEGEEAYVVDSPQLARDLARAEELQRREEARAAKLHEREMRRAEKVRRAEERRAARVAERERRRAEKLARREARRADKLRERWAVQQVRSEARDPDGFVVAPPPMAPSLPSFPYASPRVEVGVVAVEAAPLEAMGPDEGLAMALAAAVDEQRGWRGMAPVADDPALTTMATLYAQLLAEAEVVEPDDALMQALRDAEAALGPYADTAFLLDPKMAAEPHAVVAWLADNDADRDVVLTPEAAAMGVGVGTYEGVRVVVFVVAGPAPSNPAF